MKEKENSVVCRICNRKLTNPKSIERGIGPVCFEKTENAHGRSFERSYVPKDGLAEIIDSHIVEIFKIIINAISDYVPDKDAQRMREIEKKIDSYKYLSLMFVAEEIDFLIDMYFLSGVVREDILDALIILAQKSGKNIKI